MKAVCLFAKQDESKRLGLLVDVKPSGSLLLLKNALMRLRLSKRQVSLLLISQRYKREGEKVEI